MFRKGFGARSGLQPGFVHRRAVGARHLRRERNQAAHRRELLDLRERGRVGENLIDRLLGAEGVGRQRAVFPAAQPRQLDAEVVDLGGEVRAERGRRQLVGQRVRTVVRQREHHQRVLRAGRAHIPNGVLQLPDAALHKRDLRQLFVHRLLQFFHRDRIVGHRTERDAGELRVQVLQRRLYVVLCDAVRGGKADAGGARRGGERFDQRVVRLKQLLRIGVKIRLEVVRRQRRAVVERGDRMLQREQPGAGNRGCGQGRKPPFRQTV